MAHKLFVLVVFANLAFSASAHWMLQCFGDKTRMEFTEGRGGRESFVHLVTQKLDWEFQGFDEVKLYYRNHDGSAMTVHALWRETLERELVFHMRYRYLRFDLPNLSENHNFDLDIRIESHHYGSVPKVNFEKLACHAKWIVD